MSHAPASPTGHHPTIRVKHADRHMDVVPHELTVDHRTIRFSDDAKFGVKLVEKSVEELRSIVGQHVQLMVWSGKDPGAFIMTGMAQEADAKKIKPSLNSRTPLPKNSNAFATLEINDMGFRINVHGELEEVLPNGGFVIRTGQDLEGDNATTTPRRLRLLLK